MVPLILAVANAQKVDDRALEALRNGHAPRLAAGRRCSRLEAPRALERLKRRRRRKR